MGLRINHISASHGPNSQVVLADGQGRYAIGVSGSMILDPSISASNRPPADIASENPDAAYIFSGSIGGPNGIGSNSTDKTLFLGDVVVSGSLRLGGGGSFLDGSLTANRVPFAEDADTLQDSAEFTFDTSNSRVVLGDASGDQGGVSLAGGDIIFEADGKDAGGILAGSGIRLGITGSRTPGAGVIGAEFGSDAGVVIGQGGGLHAQRANGFIRVRAMGGTADVGNNTEGPGTDPGSAAVMVKADAGGLLLSGALNTKLFGKTGLQVDSQAALDIDAGGALAINSSVGVINIGNDAVNQNINIGTAGTRAIGVGSANATLTFTGDAGDITLDAGSNDIAVTATQIDATAQNAFGVLLADGQANAFSFDADSGQADLLKIDTSADKVVAYELDVTNNVTIAGNLDVNGTTTTVDTTNTSITDGLIILNSGSAASPANRDQGVIFAAPDVSRALFVDISDSNKFKFVTTYSSGSAVAVDPIANAAVVAGELTVDGVTNGALTDNRVVIAGASGVLEDDSNFRFDGTDLDIGVDGSETFKVTVSSGNTTVGGTLDVAGLASLDGGIDVDGAFTVANTSGDLATTGTGNIDGVLSLGAGAGALTFDAGSSSILTTDNAAAGLDIGSAGATDMLRFDTTNSSEQLIAGVKLVPKTDNAIDLGSNTLRFANIYTGDLNLRNDRGDWTLIEEEDFISFRNNTTGRRFRMVMEDITGTGTYGPGNDGEM